MLSLRKILCDFQQTSQKKKKEEKKKVEIKCSVLLNSQMKCSLLATSVCVQVSLTVRDILK